MNINATSNLSALTQQLFNSVDANKDGKLNTDEFQSFLENLVGAMGSKTGGLGTAATAATASSVSALDGTSTDATKVYQPMAGFDTAKLNDSTHATPKYIFARATQDLDLGNDRSSRSANLQKVADYAVGHGLTGAKVTGDDTVDFGDGMGDIDVLTGGGQWWWGPTT
jgi:hypothetical protein